MRPSTGAMGAALAVAAGLVGCGGDDDALRCPDLPMDGATLTIGGGDETGSDFETYPEGADRPLIFGSQGGFHVWMHLRGEGLCEGTLVVETRVFDPDDQMVIFQQQPMPFDATSDTGVELRAAAPMILCPSATGEVISGTTFRVTVEATDRDGRIASTEKTFTPRCDDTVQSGSFYDDCLCLCGLEGC